MLVIPAPRSREAVRAHSAPGGQRAGARPAAVGRARPPGPDVFEHVGKFLRSSSFVERARKAEINEDPVASPMLYAHLMPQG